MGYVKDKLFQWVMLALACVLFYGNTLPNGYAYDDSVVITENQFTQKGVSGIPEIFAHDSFRGSYDGMPTVARYRPLSIATLALEHEFFGQNPHISHFVNLVLLFLVSVLLYELLSKVFGAEEIRSSRLDFPLIAALLFIVHPVHTEIVSNIKGRDELLVLAGVLATTLSVLWYLDSRALRYQGLSFVFFSISLFSKENAIAFLAIIPLTIFFYKRLNFSVYVRALWPLFLAGALFLGSMALALGKLGPLPPVDIITEPFANATLLERYATAFYSFALYLRLLVFPHPLTTDYQPYHINLATWTTPMVWTSLLVCSGLLSYAIVSLRRRSIVSYGILFFLFSFSVVSNLPFSVGTFMSERFLFVPSVGFVIIVAWFLSTKVFPVIKNERFTLLVITLMCLAKTYSRNEAWKDDFTLITTDVVTSGNSIKANLSASVSYLEKAQSVIDTDLTATYREHALRHAKKAVLLYEQHSDATHPMPPSYHHAVALQCDCFSANNLLVDALQCYTKALLSAPNRDRLSEAIEATINKANDIDLRLKYYTTFASLVPDSFLFNYRLGYLYGKEKNDIQKSIHYLEKSVELKPTETHALEALSHAHKLSRDYEKAAIYLERATSENPNNRSHLTRLLAIYKLAGNREKENAILERLEHLPN